jgi:hypothetical protein
VPLPRYTSNPDEHGLRLYVVKAEMRSDQNGTQLGAGIGWYQWGDGCGVFVEHETIGSTRQDVATELDYRICHSPRDLCDARDVPFDMQRGGRSACWRKSRTSQRVHSRSPSFKPKAGGRPASQQ